jgi:hypothetical protein
MANRYFTQFFYTFFKKPVLIAGKISLSAAAAVSSSSIQGASLVAKTGTGTYTVTLADKYYSVVCGLVSSVGSTEDLVVDFVSINPTTKTVVVQTKVAGVVADVTDACELHLSVLFNDTSV